MWLSEVLSDTHTFNRLYLKDSSFKLHFLNLFFTGFEHPGPTEVPTWTEPASRKRRKGPVTARTFCHRDSSAAAVHPGDQDQEHDLQNQTQAGLHASGLWRKVIMHLHTPSPHSYSFACISDFCEDTAIAPGLKCYIHVVGASYLIELACDHLKIIQLDMDVSCGVYLNNVLVFMCRGKIVLGYTEAELRVRGSGYQFIHAADMLYCAENHVRSKLYWCNPLSLLSCHHSTGSN